MYYNFTNLHNILTLLGEWGACQLGYLLQGMKKKRSCDYLGTWMLYSKVMKLNGKRTECDASSLDAYKSAWVSGLALKYLIFALCAH